MRSNFDHVYMHADGFVLKRVRNRNFCAQGSMVKGGPWTLKPPPQDFCLFLENIYSVGSHGDEGAEIFPPKDLFVYSEF